MNEINKLLLTRKVLDIIGFSEYWDESGDFGNRKLKLNNSTVTIYIMDEHEPSSYDGCWIPYSPERIVTPDFKTELYFLHELYEYIASIVPEADLNLFVQKASVKELEGYLQTIESKKMESEWKADPVTFGKAYKMAKDGDVIYMQPGTYDMMEAYRIRKAEGHWATNADIQSEFIKQR